MQLLTAGSRPATYPDRDQDELLWIEVYSRASANRFGVVEHELEALAAASLVLQLELGRPVVKLLNLTPLLKATSATQESVSAILNYIAGLVEDPSMHSAEVVLDTALDRAPASVQQRFAEAPAFLKRAQRFVQAVGSSNDELTRPAIHLALDRPTDPADDTAPDRLSARWPSLGQRLLWWQPGVVSGASHLFRPPPSSGWVEGQRSHELVPFPLIRLDDATHLDPGLDAFRIAVAHDAGVQRGFSLRFDSQPLDDRSYGDAMIGSSLELASRLIDACRSTER